MQSALAAVQHYMAGYEAFRDMVVTNRCGCAAVTCRNNEPSGAEEFGICSHRPCKQCKELKLTRSPNTTVKGLGGHFVGGHLIGRPVVCHVTVCCSCSATQRLTAIHVVCAGPSPQQPCSRQGMPSS